MRRRGERFPTVESIVSEVSARRVQLTQGFSTIVPRGGSPNIRRLRSTKKDARPRPRVPSGSPTRERQPLQAFADRLAEPGGLGPKLSDCGARRWASRPDFVIDAHNVAGGDIVPVFGGALRESFAADSAGAGWSHSMQPAQNAEPRAMFQARGRGVGANNLCRSKLRYCRS